MPSGLGRVGALSTPLVDDRTGEERPAEVPIDEMVSVLAQPWMVVGVVKVIFKFQLHIFLGHKCSIPPPSNNS